MTGLAWFLVACSSAELPEALSAPAIPAVEAPPVVAEPTPRPIEARYAASEVLVAWTGAARAKATVARTDEEARLRAEDLRGRVAAGEDFAAIARAESDAPDAGRGGTVGTWLTGTMDPAFQAAVEAVDVGELTAVVRTEYGYAFARREAVEQVHVRQIVVAWQGASKTQVIRSKDEARARIAAAVARLDTGEDFGAVAAALSDVPSAAHGGDIGVVGKGQLVPAVEAAAFALAPGGTSGVIETPYGFEVVQRVE